MKKYYVEPHIYTQEEAVELNRNLSDARYELRKTKDKLDETKDKLKLALSCMEKEQLIAFVEKLI